MQSSGTFFRVAILFFDISSLVAENMCETELFRVKIWLVSCWTKRLRAIILDQAGGLQKESTIFPWFKRSTIIHRVIFAQAKVTRSKKERILSMMGKYLKQKNPPEWSKEDFKIQEGMYFNGPVSEKSEKAGHRRKTTKPCF